MASTERFVPQIPQEPKRTLRVIDLAAVATCLTRRARWRIMLGGLTIALGLGLLSSILKGLNIVPGGEEELGFSAVLECTVAILACWLWWIARRPGLLALAKLLQFVMVVAAIGVAVFGPLAALEGLALVAADPDTSDEQLVFTFFIYFALAVAMGYILLTARSFRVQVRRAQDSGVQWTEDSMAKSAPRWSLRQRLAVAPPSDRFRFHLYQVLAYAAFALAGAAYVGSDYVPSSGMSAEQSFKLGNSIAQVAAGLAFVAYLALRRGRRILARSSGRLLESDTRSPVLLLRAWVEDSVMIDGGPTILRYARLITTPGKGGQRLEEVIADELTALGPVRAIGKPGERLPELGAIREYAPDDQWKERVVALMRSSAVIVVVLGQDDSAGIHWELAEIDTLGFAQKTLLIFPPFAGATRAGRFKRLFARLLRRAPQRASDSANSALGYAAKILGTSDLALAGAKPLAAIRASGNDSWVATIDPKQPSSEEAYRVGLVTLLAQVGVRPAVVKSGSAGNATPLVKGSGAA